MPQPHSTAGTRRQKPDKPRPDFPLFPHNNGLWAKKIRGSIRYFGPWADPEKALKRYLDEKDDWYAGRTPRTKRGELTVEDLCNLFLDRKETQADGGEITRAVFLNYKATCKRLVDLFGKTCPVVSLQPQDFERLVARMAETLGPISRKVEVQRVKTVLKYAYDQQHIDKPIRTGQALVAPSARAIKKAANGNGGRKVFEAAELRKLIDAAGAPLKAMILLGINCGMGNHDCGSLPLSAVDLKAAWHDYPRPKTGADRRGKLWPETVGALREAIDQRPQPMDQADKDIVFLTPRGKRYVQQRGDTWLDMVRHKFAKLLKDTGVKRPGLSFYSLRHTHETVAGGCKDQVAVDYVMGHITPGMGTNYRHGVDDERLVAVADHVHAWLFPPKQQQ